MKNTYNKKAFYKKVSKYTLNKIISLDMTLISLL